MQLKTLLITPLMALPVLCYAQDNNDALSVHYMVEGTELAHLQTVIEMLYMLPGVTADETGITVAGRGTPDIYIDNRKIADLSELNHITADRVREINILRHPGAEYNKDVEAVIVVRLKPAEAEGFSLDNALRLDLTHKLSTNDALTMRWRRKAIDLNAFVGWNEERQKKEVTIFTNTYDKDHTLIDESQMVQHPDTKKQWITTRFNATYLIRQGHKLSLNYGFVGKPVHETSVPEDESRDTQPTWHHNIAAEYQGRWLGWQATLGGNAFVDHSDETTHKPGIDNFYLRKELNTRNLAKISRAWDTGTLTVGTEHYLGRMDVQMYDNNPAFTPEESAYRRTHALINDQSIGLFASVTQSWGRWDLEAGLRYEYQYATYEPCDDDGLMRYLDSPDCPPLPVTSPTADDYLLPRLQRDRMLSSTGHELYPTLKVSYKTGQSAFFVKHTQNCIKPYLGITRLRYTDIEILNKKILWNETNLSTALGWTYKWIAATATHTRYKAPICATILSTTQYNAPDYDAIDFDLTLTPKVGVWTPMLLARVHKQWFDMPLASGKDRLKKPFGSITCTNIFSLPQHWTLRLGAQWHAKGAERNIYYFNDDLRLDASLQKTLPRQGLTFVLSATNLTHDSYLDQGRYTQHYYSVSQGLREHTPRTFSLTIRYKM